MESLIPDTITIAWIVNLVIAFIVGLISGRLLRIAIWLAVLLVIVFLLVQFIVVTPTVNLRSFLESEQLSQLGQNAAEWIRSIIPHFEEHLRANSTLIAAFALGFVVSFFRRRG